jgi:ABC-type sugar transport system ATPase subunit
MGIGLVPSDRASDGLFPDMTVSDNIASAALDHVSSGGLFRSAKAKELARHQQERLRIKADSLDQLVRLLSGGNQQKVLLAKWLSLSLKVLIVDEPTQGIDVGARAEIHHLLRELANRGVAVLMVSSDLLEVIGLCDRVAVMAQSRIQGILEGTDATEEEVMMLATRAA